MEKEKLKRLYEERTVALAEEITILKRHNSLFVIVELAAFFLMLGSLAIYISSDNGSWWLIMAASFLAAYLLTRRKDILKNSRANECEKLLKVYQNEQNYLAGNFTCFNAGEKYVNTKHPFTYDLDIFGRDSLFNRINRTVTTGGSDFLAKSLSIKEVPTQSTIVQRREAINELSNHETLRMAFMASGESRQIDTDDILKALCQVRKSNISHLALRKSTFCMAILSLGMTYGLVGASVFGSVPAVWSILWILIQIMGAFAFFGLTLREVNKSIIIILPRLGTYVNLMMHIVESNLKSTENRKIIDKLSMGNADAVQSFRQLNSILHDLDQRNEIWVPISNALYLADYFIVRRFLRWQQQYISCMEDWISAVSHFDALVSMATFRYNEPEGIEAEFFGEESVHEKVVYQAQGLYHPFLGANAVKNDFEIQDGHFHIITGANMAGKSTFLRSVGINYVLALCGMPVFAEHMTLSRFSLFTSMRTTDDLTHGISYFNAELLRLQQLIVYCKQHASTLIILDEILKGTNSLDKLNGSRLFLKAITTLPVTGIVATHDLELSHMAEQHPTRFSNYCFEIRLSNEIIYNYKIAEGVARNQNATYLLKHILQKENLLNPPSIVTIQQQST